MAENGDVGPDGRNVAENWMGSDNKTMLVAEDVSTGRIVGCCGVARGESEKGDVPPPPESKKDDVEAHLWSIWRLSVDESTRGSGCGRLLMSEAESFAKNRGALKIRASTINHAASGFYVKLGYTRINMAQHVKTL